MIQWELLEPLRALNVAETELRHGGLDPAHRQACEAQVRSLRARLPVALLAHHDRMARRGAESVAAVVGSSCGACHLKLPVGQLAELNSSGRIGVCPHCGVFLFNPAAAPAVSRG